MRGDARKRLPATCPTHGDLIIYEPGGPNMPTIFGRDYCPTCQDDFIAALEAVRDE